jgi:hypothetical protein
MKTKPKSNSASKSKSGTALPGVVLVPLKDANERRALRVLAMVHELHKAGYQRLRICPGMSGSGGAWRCTVTPISNVLRSDGALIANFDALTAHYSSAQKNLYFDWLDAKTSTARELANLFIKRFPDIAAAGLGEDWAYAGWYVLMLGFAEQGEFPVAYAEWWTEPNPRFLPTDKRGVESGLSMPPVGEADASSARP